MVIAVTYSGSFSNSYSNGLGKKIFGNLTLILSWHLIPQYKKPQYHIRCPFISSNQPNALANPRQHMKMDIRKVASKGVEAQRQVGSSLTQVIFLKNNPKDSTMILLPISETKELSDLNTTHGPRCCHIFISKEALEAAFEDQELNLEAERQRREGRHQAQGVLKQLLMTEKHANQSFARV